MVLLKYQVVLLNFTKNLITMNTEKKINRLTSKKTRIENKIAELGDNRPKRTAKLNEKLVLIQEKLDNLS